MFLWSLPYRDEQRPYYWGTPTSAQNFCEEDYIIHPQVAEFINTLSNVPYILFALHGLHRSRQRGDPWHRTLPYLGLLSVGIGSSLFHASLKLYPQLLDSLSMLYATAFVMHQLITCNHPSEEAFQRSAMLAVAVLLFSVIHCMVNDLNLHSLVFASMITYIALNTSKMIKKVEQRDWQRQARKWARFGSCCCVLGYALWLIDTFFCPTLRSWRRQMGLPWGFLLELHGWWHFLTGVGAYTFIVLVQVLTSGQTEEGLYAKTK